MSIYKWIGEESPQEVKAERDALRILNTELADVLNGLIRVNETWNEEVSKIIGRPTNWNDSYLHQARIVLAKVTEFNNLKFKK